MGNRLSDGAGTSYAYNALNQLTGMTSSGGTSVSFTFDAAGNMTQDGSATPPASLSWDESNRLIAYDRPAGASSPAIHAEYAYAPDARRLCKSVDGVTTYFLYTDEGLRAEYDAEGQVIRAYAYRPNTLWMTQPLLLHARPLGAPPTEPLTTHLYLVDHLHAPEKLTTLSGTLAWQAQESAFGATTPAPSATAENPLRLSSQYWDNESLFLYNTFRYYNFPNGRYISADPIRLLGGYNSHAFSFNNSINLRDPLGLACDTTHGTTRCTPSDCCETLSSKISQWTTHAKERQAELWEDANNLRQNDPIAYNNHIDKMEQALVNLGKCIGYFYQKGCQKNSPPPTLPKNFEYPDRVPMQEPNGPSTDVILVTGAAVGAGYVTYRIIRLIIGTAVFPPSLPANLLCP